MRYGSTLIAVTIAAVVYSGCASLPVCQSEWRGETETSSAFRFYDPKTKVRYDVKNDADHLYVRMDVIDSETIIRILKTGSMLSFSPAGKKKTKTSLEFPSVNSETPISLHPSLGQGSGLNASMSNPFGALPKEGLIYSADTLNLPLFAGVETKGALIKMEMDPGGALIYEARIPRKWISGLGNEFRLGFKTGAFKIDDPEYERQLRSTGAEGLDRSAGFNQNRTMNPGNPGGMNQPYGNVYQPGPGTDPYRSAPPRLNIRSALSDPLFFWVQVTLSNQP